MSNNDKFIKLKRLKVYKIKSLLKFCILYAKVALQTTTFDQ